jgi:hypothetical protein
LHEAIGSLRFPVNRYQHQGDAYVDLRIVVLHHPFHWLAQSNYRPLRTLVRTIAEIVLTGHEHVGSVGTNIDPDSGESVYIEGCVLQSDKTDLSDSSFDVIRLDLAEGRFSATKYLWSNTRYKAQDEGSWRDYRNLPKKAHSRYPIRAEFIQLLDDPGAAFKHPAKVALTLRDVFVYPDLERVGEPGKKFATENASVLRHVRTDRHAALIEGDEKSGRTSLLRQLFKEYHDAGLIPLILNGSDCRRSDDVAIESLLNRAIVSQYETLTEDEYQQIPKSKKALLIDDLDDCPAVSRAIHEALYKQLSARCEVLVVTVGPMFELREFSRGLDEVATITHYHLKSFGHVLRGQLISRWFGLGTDPSVDEVTAQARRHQAEGLIDAVMTRSLVPATPLYILILLQSIEGGRDDEFRHGALGHYYHFMLVQGFQIAGVKPQSLTELFQYCSQLAWYFHSRGTNTLSLDDLRKFNGEFSMAWHTVDLDRRLRELEQASILLRDGEQYGFRYAYVYYYFKGQYLSESLADIDTRAYIKHCCSHLYVRDNANTVLFLAHHTNDDFVLAAIADSLQAVFPDRMPLSLDDDTGVVTHLIAEAPRLRYSGQSPEDSRRRRDEMRDELDETGGHDGLADTEEPSRPLSRVAQMTALFKTTEILGHVLKNQYSKIPRPRRVELIRSLFDGPLRALSDFYQFCNRNPQTLVVEIEAALARRQVGDEETRCKVARKVVASMILALSAAFISRAANGASAQSLSEDVREVVRVGNTLALRLIELAVILDAPGTLPRQKIKQLQKDMRANPVGKMLLDMFLMNRLYMFRTAEKDMQWLASEIGLDLGAQHAITYIKRHHREG